jgi:uncharacterized protein YecE (DUF72 family)
VRVGTAGWTIPKAFAVSFASVGSHLARYARRFDAVEINSSFHRPHRRSTYERWSASVPDHFRFAVKVPKTITHQLKLSDAEASLDAFLEQTAGLGGKLGPLLVQLPPSLTFEADVVRGFFAMLRDRHAGDVVCEPRHPTWFAPEAEALLTQFRVARVAADPAKVPAAAAPGGWPGLRYIRLHGAPRVYYSDYPPEQIAEVARGLLEAPSPAWCIFDNTALGAATGNALALKEMLSAGPSS